MNSPDSGASNLSGESDVTDIEIAPDGRLFLFGASREVLELLVDVGLAHKKSQPHVLDRVPVLSRVLTEITDDQ